MTVPSMTAPTMTVPILSLLLFAIAGAFTPGPNNMISLASGAAFGFRRTLPQIWGVTFGFMIMVVAVGLGLGGLFAAVPSLHEILRYAGAGYLLYLAWKIAKADPASGAAIAKPFTVLQGAAFQWVNPKAWTMALSVVPAFTAPGGDVIAEVLVIAFVMGIVSFPALSMWAGFGMAISRIVSDPRKHRLINVGMALLVVASVVLLFR
ncbi:LysE family translocator [Ancylobacter sp. 6x-1]|uniref:LysE family translocator n=1 Tax=Ancylobacter crimeensis TaxID=2579147 RepID=A0ABT0DA71_9HYPH|nr:LysE family translocator [Ancylobacter crimeensis]MCK0196858.1 LysE family translocator [Ancylobacter crimeensis]